jgi:hypothetical protein
MRPAGLSLKKKDNSKKNWHENLEWQKAKKLGRPAQQFNLLIGTWSKIMEPKKVTA